MQPDEQLNKNAELYAHMLLTNIIQRYGMSGICLACMFYGASQRVQRAITLCGMWVSEYELLITGSQDLQIVSSHRFG